jgi:hypothetical protein
VNDLARNAKPAGYPVSPEGCASKNVHAIFKAWNSWDDAVPEGFGAVCGATKWCSGPFRATNTASLGERPGIPTHDLKNLDNGGAGGNATFQAFQGLMLSNRAIRHF